MATLERPIIWNYIFCSEAVIVIVLYGRSCSLQLIGPRKIWQTPTMYFLSLACLHACLLVSLLACMSACKLLLAMHQRQKGSHPWRLQKHQRQRETVVPAVFACAPAPDCCRQERLLRLLLVIKSTGDVCLLSAFRRMLRDRSSCWNLYIKCKMACLGFQTSHLKRRFASFGTRTETQLAEQVDQAKQQSEHHVTTGRRRHRLAKDRKVQKQRELAKQRPRESWTSKTGTGRTPRSTKATPLALRIRCLRWCYAGGGQTEKKGSLCATPITSY